MFGFGANKKIEQFYFCDVEEAKSLLKKMDINGKDKEGQTPLFVACRHSNLDVMKMLIAAGADLESKDNDGQTALFFACRMDRIEVAKMLIAAGADLSSAVGATKNPEILKLLEDAKHLSVKATNETAESDVDEGYGWDEEDEEYFNQHNLPEKPENTVVSAEVPLATSTNDSREMLNLLRTTLHGDTSVNAETAQIGGNQWLVLLLTSAYNSLESLQNAIRIGRDSNLDINYCSAAGKTVLIIAAEKGVLSAVKNLVEAGADVRFQDQNGKTAQDIAFDNQHDDIVRYLSSLNVVPKSVEPAKVESVASRDDYVNLIEQLMARPKESAQPIVAKTNNVSTYNAMLDALMPKNKSN